MAIVHASTISFVYLVVQLLSMVHAYTINTAPVPFPEVLMFKESVALGLGGGATQLSRESGSRDPPIDSHVGSLEVKPEG